MRRLSAFETHRSNSRRDAVSSVPFSARIRRSLLCLSMTVFGFYPKTRKRRPTLTGRPLFLPIS